MKLVATESRRVLKKGKYCAILMGDMRRKGHVIQIILKEQHNCKATGYWKTNSVKYNFLLLAHEYLFVFEKPFS
jgi:hypothetical protein